VEAILLGLVALVFMAGPPFIAWRKHLPAKTIALLVIVAFIPLGAFLGWVYVVAKLAVLGGPNPNPPGDDHDSWKKETKEIVLK
jgi:hypothetical protein